MTDRNTRLEWIVLASGYCNIMNSPSLSDSQPRNQLAVEEHSEKELEPVGRYY